jgi:hypothetical protein
MGWRALHSPSRRLIDELRIAVSTSRASDEGLIGARCALGRSIAWTRQPVEIAWTFPAVEVQRISARSRPRGVIPRLAISSLIHVPGTTRDPNCAGARLFACGVLIILSALLVLEDPPNECRAKCLLTVWR